MTSRTPLRRPASLALALVAAALASPIVALDLQQELERRWEGAWVVISAPISSNCDDLHTNNEVVPTRDGAELVSKGRLSFEPGELARVTKIDLKRRRVDLLLEIWEPLLVTWNEGPFELHREAVCKVELLFPLAREVVTAQQVEPVERALSRVVARYSDEASARLDPGLNDRRVEPFPEGWEETWIDYQIWKYSGAIARAGEEIDRIGYLTRDRDEPEYALGFSKGLRHHVSLPSDCLALAEATPPYPSGTPPSHYDGDQKDDWRDGYAGGARISFLTAQLAGLSSCLADVR